MADRIPAVEGRPGAAVEGTRPVAVDTAAEGILAVDTLAEGILAVVAGILAVVAGIPRQPVGGKRRQAVEAVFLGRTDKPDLPVATLEALRNERESKRHLH